MILGTILGTRNSYFVKAWVIKISGFYEIQAPFLGTARNESFVKAKRSEILTLLSPTIFHGCSHSSLLRNSYFVTQPRSGNPFLQPCLGPEISEIWSIVSNFRSFWHHLIHSSVPSVNLNPSSSHN
jgi:hypothetical protein